MKEKENSDYMRSIYKKVVNPNKGSALIKKSIAGLITVLFMLLPSLAVYSDMVIEPKNDFYDRHRNQIIRLDRGFSANGAGGFASVLKEPGRKNVVGKLQNGEVTDVQYSCLYNGDFWGFTLEYSGWIKMDQLLVLYDYVAFGEDHFDEFYSYSGDYAGIKEARSAIAWPWPGADEPLWTFEDLNADSFSVAYAYKDSESREWGFVTYLYGSRNIWFCLSDPQNRDIPAFNPAPEPGVWKSETVHIDIRQQIDEQRQEYSMPVVIIIMVAVLVIGTGVLIRVFWKPGKTEQGGGRQ